MSRPAGNWAILPSSARRAVIAAESAAGHTPGNGNGWFYQYQQEAPPADYRGPMPYCRYLGRTRRP
jgi:hypothetical protein